MNFAPCSRSSRVNVSRGAIALLGALAASCESSTPPRSDAVAQDVAPTVDAVAQDVALAVDAVAQQGRPASPQSLASAQMPAEHVAPGSHVPVAPAPQHGPPG